MRNDKECLYFTHSSHSKELKINHPALFSLTIGITKNITIISTELSNNFFII